MRRHTLRLTAAAVAATTVTGGLLAGAAFAAPGAPPGAAGSPKPGAAGSPKPGSAAGTKPGTSRSALPRNATLQQVQAAATTAVNARVGALNDAAGRVQKAGDLGGDQAALLHALQADVAGLQQLGGKIAADPTVQTARADYEHIFTGFRVYVLVLPVTRTVGAIDRIDNTVDPRLTTVAGRISSHLTPADQGQVQPLLGDLATQVGTSKSATTGLAATLEGYSPAGWNANHALLADARGKVKAARAAVTKARGDAKQATADVRAARRSGRTGRNATPPG
jgi:hypothetical protein